LQSKEEQSGKGAAAIFYTHLFERMLRK